MFTTYGALIGLAIAIFLIIRKVTPAYALIFGALAGGLINGGGLTDTVAAMIDGTKAMMPSVLRILASGVLVGALVKTGSAAKIADAIVGALGTRLALTAVALSTMIVCAVGVFIDIAVITVAPVALAVGRKAKLPVSALLVAMIGGGKAGNIISPNPNTIAAADAFKIELTSLMGANIIPAIAALVVTILISMIMARRAGDVTTEVAEDDVASATDLPSFMQAVIGPLTVVVLLALRPLCGIAVDPLVALPVGGLVCNLVTGKWRDTVANSEFGLSKVIGEIGRAHV